MNNTLKPHLLLLISTIIAGFNYSISKIVMPFFIAPSAIIIIRDVISLLFFGLFYLIFSRQKIDKKDFPKLILCAFFGAASNQLLFYEGLNLTTPINASLMMTGSPIFVLMISVYAGKEKMTLLKITGILLSAAGVVLLLLSSSSKGVENFYLGDILVLLNALCWAAYVVLIKPLTQKYDTLTLMTFIFFWGTLFVTPFGYNKLLAVDWLAMTSDAWLALLFIVLCATIISYFLNTYAIKFVNPSLSGSYIYLQPVFASIVALSLGKDIITWEKVLLSLMIFAGIFMVSRKNNVEQTENL